MPVYEYRCDDCAHVFEEIRSMADYRAPAPCPLCQEPADRIVFSAPRLSNMRPEIRKAHERNERSAHEPRFRRGHVCGPGCNHGHGSADKTTSSAPPPVKGQPGKRPWMLGH